jgi:hypothetical protein
MRETSVPPMSRCSECGEQLKVHDEYIILYFSGIPITCSACSNKLDWWKIVLRETHDNFMLNQAFMQIGAKSKIFQLRLSPNERTHYKLSDYGIPENARILYVNYTPYTEGGNGYFPIEMTGNVPTRRYPRNEVTLWPVPLGEGTAEYSEVSVYVTYVDHSELDEPWENLVNAYDLYVSEQYESCIVPANVAVESTLSIFLTHYLKKFAGKNRVKTFLEDGATYSHQLNVVLQFVVKTNSLPELPGHIRGCLNQLRSLRNQMAHNGKTDKTMTKKIASELLCASLFGFKYIQFVNSELNDKKI